MKNILDINWNNFKAKFNGKEQNTFEGLCYLLFCKEYNKPTGITGFVNQVGIEKNPIKANGKLVGFQAKFYETRLSENANDFITSIDKTVIRHPSINKILFYTNQDFGQSNKGTDPKYKKRIDEHAKSKGVELEWRTNRSFFQSPFVREENINIAQHFFSLDRSNFDLINDLTLHTESILGPIRSEIIYNKNKIKIDRSGTVSDLNKSIDSSQLVLLSGVAGVGKTAIIKDFYKNKKSTDLIFVFKATEFNIPNINHLFKTYGDFTLADFMYLQEAIVNKIIIVDSAEKLSEIEHQDVFKEFLSTLLDNKWKIIFTTRHSYLDALQYQIIEIYKTNYKLINIEPLTNEEIANYSNKHTFNLPDQERLQELICIPFYLNEYLQIYHNVEVTISYSDFINIMWNKHISKISYKKNNTHIKRENCFINIAKKRVNEGHFFIKVTDGEEEILQKLVSDEILDYNSNASGYFITHDIYEEWALDKIIEIAFQNSNNVLEFYEEIGTSLPIRKAYRNWLSEKFFLKQADINSLIESTISDKTIKTFWKDEILVSVFLSKYSNEFFETFEEKFVDENYGLLIKSIFLLRTSCKDIDKDLMNRLGVNKPDYLSLKYLYTIPNGDGWSTIIAYINKIKESLGLKFLDIILPLLDDWNNKIKKGETTKNASKIALYYYDELTKNGGFGYRVQDEIKTKLIRTILNGSKEIKSDLEKILNKVISEKDTDFRSKYYELIKVSLTYIPDSMMLIKTLPKIVLKIANLFWFKESKEDSGLYGYNSPGVEQYFCISDRHDFKYYPASAYQTPIFQLLNQSPKDTIDFIIYFINKAVECYSKSRFKKEVKSLTIYLDNEKLINQIHSDRLWFMYRGGQVSTCLLESIHMALEKWLLNIGNMIPQKELEDLCMILLQKSKSSSITAVITSIVQAFPDKLFNIAKILFKSKEIFSYDIARWTSDQTGKSLYLIGYGFNYNIRIFEDERIKAFDQIHRKMNLEHLALNYQLFRNEGVDEKEAVKRQEIIWHILDNYYDQLPAPTNEQPVDKIWRLALARMDRRKMKISSEKKDGKYQVKLDPKIDPKLKKHSENALKQNAKVTEFLPLKIWSESRFRKKRNNYKGYPKYETSPSLVIADTKLLINKADKQKGDLLSLSGKSISSYTCSVLIRDFYGDLNKEQREFCKSIIIEYASKPVFGKQYNYQLSDGSEPAINILSKLISYFPKDKYDIKSLLFLLLLNPWKNISIFACNSIIKFLWKDNFKEANSILIGYLLLKPKYNTLAESIRKENHKNNIYSSTYDKVSKSFLKKYQKEIEKVIQKKIEFGDIENLENIDLDILNKAFELIPLKTDRKEHHDFLKIIFPIFANIIFSNSTKNNYEDIHAFIEKFAYIILTSNKQSISNYTKPFVENFKTSDYAVDFLRQFIYAEDKLNRYEEFWIVWNILYPKIVEISTSEKSHYTKGIIRMYLLAGVVWNSNASDWHSFKTKELVFLKKAATDMGHHPSVIYSIAKNLNDIGSNYVEKGINLIDFIIKNNNNLYLDKLDENTIYYIENILKKYILLHSIKAKRSKKIRDSLFAILDFLISKGSTTGYLLRENIL